MILKYVDSSHFNDARHTRRLTELEELNTYVFANADGTRSVYMMHENVKYIDKNGVIKEKDISLTHKAGGFGIAQSDIELLIPNNPVQGVDFEYSGFTIKLTPQDLTVTASAVQSDNSIVYNEAYGKNTKLVYTPLLSGVKEDIVLTEYTADATYTFVLETDGLSLYNDGNRYYLAASGKAEPIFYLGEIVIYDAIGKPDMGTMMVETISEGQKYLLTVIANDEFLSDPTTVYPVTIDPSITVSDSDTSGSIIDAPIFAGHPDRNYGAYTYNRVGTPAGSYGIGRTVVKLSGLTSRTEYQTITANQITNVAFYAREASGGARQYINLYPLTGNTTWTESSVTWNNIGSYTTSVNYGNTMYDNQWTAFDITNLVKAWKNGTYSADAGFIMTNENEANNKCFCSSEYSNSSYRPYVVMTYDTAISLNYTSTSIVEGGTQTLVATTKPSGLTVTWSTSNSAIATVSSSGVVTAKKAGTVIITASMVDADGITRTATCTVYVYIANSVYYIKNLNSNYYLHVKDGGIANLTDVHQYSKYSDTADAIYRIRQMWKTYYLGNGRYSIRPLNKLDKGLDVTGGNVDIYTIGTDTLSGVPSFGQWTIEWYSTGYVFKNAGSDSLTMQIENASASSGATVVASTYSTSVNCRWGLTEVTSPPAGAYLYDTAKEAIVTTVTRTVNVGTTKSLSALQLSAVAYSGTNISQNFTWYSSNNAIATVDSNGAVTGVSTGKATITGRVYRNSAYHYVSYTIYVGFPSLFSSLINSNIIDADKVDLTDDGLFLTTEPLSDILGSKGIYYLPEKLDESKTRYIYSYYDDWYIFAVTSGTSTSYGLYKMREQESDYVDTDGDGSMDADLDDPGITISFINFDMSTLATCLNNPSVENKYSLLQELNSVTGPGVAEYDEVITNYFANTASDGPYLIAEKYIAKLVNASSTNTIKGPNKMVEIMNEIDNLNDQIYNNIWFDNSALAALIQKKTDLERVPNALEAINQAAGRTIYNSINNTINIQDRTAITLYEKQAILACFTADISFNMFAAEVEYHADFALSWPLHSGSIYESTIRADMAIGEEYESGVADQYYNPNSTLVQAQADAHGVY